MKNVKLKIIILIFIFLGAPLGSQATVLYLEPEQGQYRAGDTFIVEARIDPKGECVNAIEADLSFSNNILEAVDFSEANSILTAWVKTPKINQDDGLVGFIAGIPGGFCGSLPGDPGQPNLLGRIIFRAKYSLGGRTSAKIEFLNNSQVLLNDGFGTSASLRRQPANFIILPEESVRPLREWQEELGRDNILPDPFEIEIRQDPAVFEGKYFVIFSTTDKQTGIDYYEIKEGRGEWRRAVSPYLLADQKLKSKISVRAVDKAGNERVAEYNPPPKPIPYWTIIIILIIVLTFGLWIIRYRK